MSLVEWINTIVPHFYLSVKASDEEMRASLLDGDILSQILFKLKYTSNDEVSKILYIIILPHTSPVVDPALFIYLFFKV